jgi:hypothetical protein
MSSKEASLAAAADQKLVKQVQRRRETVVLKWDAVFRNLRAKKDSLTNRNGKTRTFEENKMVLLALRRYVELHLKMVKLGVQDNINWTTIEKEVAFSFGIKQEHVNDLREEFLITGQVIVREKHAVEAEARDVEAVQEIPVMRNIF